MYPLRHFQKISPTLLFATLFTFSLPYDEKSNACIEENVKLSAEKADKSRTEEALFDFENFQN